jgi:hypothetical protein
MKKDPRCGSFFVCARGSPKPLEQAIQRLHDRGGTYIRPLTRKDAPLAADVPVHAPGQPDGTDRLVGRPAGGPCNPGHRHADLDTGMRYGTQGHGARYGFADGTVLRNQTR